MNSLPIYGYYTNKIMVINTKYIRLSRIYDLIFERWYLHYEF